MKQFLFYELLFMLACDNNNSFAEKQLIQNSSPEGKLESTSLLLQGRMALLANAITSSI